MSKKKKKKKQKSLIIAEIVIKSVLAIAALITSISQIIQALK